MPPSKCFSCLKTVCRDKKPWIIPQSSISARTFRSNAIPRTLYQQSAQRAHSTVRARAATHGAGNGRRPAYVAACLCAVAMTYGIQQQFAPWQPHRLDSNPTREPLSSGVKVEVTGKDHDEKVDKAPTGTSKIPFFPRDIWLPRSGGADIEGKSAALPAGIGPAREEEEYHLVGLGVRTVSFLSIQVYVVGFYVAKGDLGRLQQELIRVSVPEGSTASTLVQGEKDELRKRLLDGNESEKIWAQVLKNGSIRSAVRIVPVRDTNFGHLRDGWLRGIDMRSKGPEFAGDEFKASVAQFKAILGGRGSVGKGRVMLLGRGDKGDLRAWVEEGSIAVGDGEQNLRAVRGDKMELLGHVEDERVSRLVWMGYLAGSKVASEAARDSVIEGVMEVVQRPSGTLETQVL